MIHRLFILVLCLPLAGCLTPFRSPPDVAHLKLEGRDSPTVGIAKVWLERHSGVLYAVGYVMRQPAAQDTSGTHLDVLMVDAEGRRLSSAVGAFEPAHLRRQVRGASYGSYRVALGPLPAGTSRIEVLAHDGPH